MDHADQSGGTIHVFIGTKAQYIKTAPLLRLLDAEGVPYHLIDSGQHGALSVGLRRELGVREPDHVLRADGDIDSIPRALWWSLRILLLVFRPGHLRRVVFGGHRRGDRAVCVVHGDTPSTLLSTVLARRIGIPVAHLEAGLTSGRLWDPIPEEAIRRIVMRLSALLFAPDATTHRHLEQLGVRGRIVPVEANTVVEAMDHALGESVAAGSGPAIVTMHRVENLTSADRVAGLVDRVVEAAADHSIRFVLHGPTRPTLAKAGHLARLEQAGVELVDLQPHGEFVRMLAAAPWVITDGGSIQEECALLGVPTLLWRQRSEREDGLGRNVVLGNHDAATARDFLADPARHRHPPLPRDREPSRVILEELRGHLAASG